MPKIDPRARPCFRGGGWIECCFSMRTSLLSLSSTPGDFHLQSNVVLVFVDVHLTVAISDGEGPRWAFRFEPQKIKMAVASVAISSYHSEKPVL
jgi:hypothetical protein